MKQRTAYILIKKTLDYQGDAVINHIKTFGTQSALQQLDNLVLYQDLQVSIERLYLIAGRDAVLDTLIDIKKLIIQKADGGMSGGFFSELWRIFVNGYSKTIEVAQRISKINDTTKERFRDIIGRNQESGKGSAMIARTIEKEITQVNKVRSLLIARTELTTINGVASQYSAEQSEQITGVLLEKGWSTRLDGRERPEHELANGQFVPLSGKFTVGGKQMKYTGDPNGGAENVCNCRCTMIYKVKAQ